MAWGKDYRQVLGERIARLRERREIMLAKQDAAASREMVEYFDREIRLVSKEIREKIAEREAERVRRERKEAS